MRKNNTENDVRIISLTLSLRFELLTDLQKNENENKIKKIIYICDEDKHECEKKRIIKNYMYNIQWNRMDKDEDKKEMFIRMNKFFYHFSPLFLSLIHVV